MTLEEALRRPTIPVPVAGSIFFGMGREASYKAARCGDIPTVKVGGRVLAVVAPIAEMLGLRRDAAQDSENEIAKNRKPEISAWEPISGFSMFNTLLERCQNAENQYPETHCESKRRRRTS